MYGEQHLFISVLFGLCHVEFSKKSLDIDSGGNTLISALISLNIFKLFLDFIQFFITYYT